MKTLILANGFKREEKEIKNYGKDLNNLKIKLAEEFNITLSQAHKIIKTLNRKGKVIFNNGTVAFMVRIKEQVIKKINNLITECLTYVRKLDTETNARDMHIKLIKIENELNYYRFECSVHAIDVNRLIKLRNWLFKALNY